MLLLISVKTIMLQNYISNTEVVIFNYIIIIEIILKYFFPFSDQNLLQSALQSATSLRQLILHNIASDSILGVIGRSCPNLTHLDVAHSRQVTDAGMRQLFLQIEIRDKNPLASKYSHSLTRRNPLSAWSRLRNLFRLVYIYLQPFTNIYIQSSS